MTLGMDAAAGHTTARADQSYAIENRTLGTLNARNVAVQAANDAIWHWEVLGLAPACPNMRFARRREILDPSVEINKDGSLANLFVHIPFSERDTFFLPRVSALHQ